ncbi:MAG: hypothetical protein ACREJC_07515 [Tepidisphaeraceae bacterium]
MDLVSGIVGLEAAQTASRIQIAVARKILATQRLEGDSAIKLIEAATAGVCRAGDALTAAATGLGSSLDIYG